MERRVLLTGCPSWPGATRFGWLCRGDLGRVDVEAVRRAWAELGEELLAEWRGHTCDRYRKRCAEPWAVRVLGGET